MAPISGTQLDAIRTGIQGLTTPSISVVDVSAEVVDGVDGSTVLVTVLLTPPDAGSEWDVEDFLEIRRQARTVAVTVLGGQEVRLVYGSDSPTDTEDDESDAGGKQALEQDS